MQEVAEKIGQNQVQSEELTAEEQVAGVPMGSPHEVLEHLIGQVRSKVREAFIQATETEFRLFVGADPYKRSEERQDYRNGSRPRDLVTELGTLVDFPIPRAREGNF